MSFGHIYLVFFFIPAIYRGIETSCEDFDGFPVPRNTSVASFLRPGDTLGVKTCACFY